MVKDKPSHQTGRAPGKMGRGDRERGNDRGNDRRPRNKK
jgi:hypothetical protein